jgi:hypothetical protein
MRTCWRKMAISKSFSPSVTLMIAKKSSVRDKSIVSILMIMGFSHFCAVVVFFLAKSSKKLTILREAFGVAAVLGSKRLPKGHGWNIYRVQDGFAQLIQTAFIERVNLTIRRGVAPLMRKTWSLAQNPEHLLLHVEWWRSYYHFVRPHESLSILIPGLRKCQPRSPAQAANLTGKLWTVEDVLKLPLIPVPT